MGTARGSDFLAGVYRNSGSAFYVSSFEQLPHFDAGVIVYCVGT